MLYQSYKYFVVRVGVSVFILVTFGFMTLFFIHEVALPNVHVDGTAVKLGLIVFSLILGFMAYGFAGGNGFKKTLADLDDIDLKADEKKITARFEALLRYTYSSYFLPGLGKKLRQKVVRKYADYLLGIGKEDPRAMKIYLSAFLQNPVDSKFRTPLIAALTSKEDLDRRERDLLMAMLKAGDYQDKEIFNHLVRALVKKKQFTNKTEPLFVIALENRIEEADKVVEFLLPILLKKKRADEFAIRIYLNVLPMVGVKTRSRLQEIIARNYCGEKFLRADPILHSRCANVYENLPESERLRIMKAVQEKNISSKWSKVKIFSGEDVKALESWKANLGIGRTLVRRVYDGCVWLLNSFRSLGRTLILKLLTAFEMFGARSLSFKLICSFLALFALFAGLGFIDWGARSFLNVSSNNGNEILPSEKSPSVTRIHTIQIAAVTSQKKADRILFLLKKKKIESLYIVRVQRQTGGYWYKIRAGRFDTEEEAKSFGNRLIDGKMIKNYFVITFGE